jgi:hypothetical protein
MHPFLQDGQVAEDSCVNGADTAWVLLSFVLVLAMFPGLALFEGGLLPVSDHPHLMTHSVELGHDSRNESGPVTCLSLRDVSGRGRCSGSSRTRSKRTLL